MAGDRDAAAQMIPPHLVRQDFLDAGRVEALYDFACAHEADFTPTETRGGINPKVRMSQGLRKLGPFAPMLRERLLALAPGLVAELGVDAFTPTRIELQLVAHGDGAFYTRHIDTRTGEVGADENHLRILSAVYYFHRRPKAFEGGALRLYSFATDQDFVDIEPAHNCLLAFPSWAPHEVRPVRVPAQRFADSRFAINCWLYKER